MVVYNAEYTSGAIMKEGGEIMAGITRKSVSLPTEVEEQVIKLRKRDEFCRCSYSELVRRLITAGLQAVEAERDSA